MATNPSYAAACQVGSSGTTPSVSQTALISRIAGSTTQVVNNTIVSGSVPYYVALQRSFRFAEGVAAGNIAEVGIGTGPTGTTLFSRSLVKDSLGNPTTITILPDESLDVIYELRYYAPDEISGVIVATGNIGGTYDYTLRPSNVSTVGTGNGWSMSPQTQNGSGSTGSIAYEGAIGLPTAQPSGASATITLPTAGSYTSGNFYLDRAVTASAAQANSLASVRSMFFKMGVGSYQIEFDPPIPKTSNDVIQLTIRLSWGRRP